LPAPRTATCAGGERCALLDDRDAVAKLAGSLRIPSADGEGLRPSRRDLSAPGRPRSSSGRLRGGDPPGPGEVEHGFLELVRTALRAYAEQDEQGPRLALECGKLGRAYVTAGLLSGTVAGYSEAMRLDPRYAWPFNNLAWQLT
jgi:hypothetical protein